MSSRFIRVFAAMAGAFILPLSVKAQSGPAPSEIERSGQSGWQFLKINGDARQAAMGGAFSAISRGDASAVFGNPASLADVRGFDVQVSALKWVADIGHSSVAIAGSVGDVGVFALSVAMLNYGDIAETINMSTGADGTTPLVTGNTFTAGDIAAGLSYARNITDRLSVGGSFRLMRETIAELSMNNWSLDFGTLYYTGVSSLRIAVTARNFGPDSRFGGWSEQYQTLSDNVRMPLDIRLGMAMDFLDDEQSPHLLTVVVEGDHPNDGTEKFHVGVSYGFEKTFFLRGGYKFNYDVQKYTFGAGINFPIGSCLGTVSYAYVDFGVLTQVHMFSLGFAF